MSSRRRSEARTFNRLRMQCRLSLYFAPEIIVWTIIVSTSKFAPMATSATRRAAARRFDSPEQEAYLALWRTYDRLRALEDELFSGFDLTAQQYNLLRLLRAAVEPVPTLALAERLVSRAPDITRMLDKLEQRGLLTRTRSATDRRTVFVAVTQAGRLLLDAIADPLRDCHQRQLGHLSANALKSLTALLKTARAPHEPDNSPWA
jgi:DNA-binding MarR family transcriptional regulator